ncbi:beta-ketoacyl synthase N-terminal-like domain-containing protein [Dactylosporangium sp. AC04546]|uniref:beta-ketoacyl synthase N-terminal-like domain-containing protein n=1 Tax=Dactylosporangium sp. AC04546 TaxID=2862460 RepID=UPI001EE0F625|nr:beta-ketoacyl synthase N-terminal-like domain-containing protein [Dactylosporangium sp. AC04546]WVK79068.1 beta-ketoacyl synthase N-terminal-like domain-containing protein [Dactylosporangium sp. AC04546]
MTAVITGLGVLAPTGLGTEAYWRATLDGRSGIGPITRFDASGYPVRLAGELPGFDPAGDVPSRLLPQTDVWTQHGLAAAAQALRDAALDPAELPEYGVGVATASSAGGVEFGQREIERLWSQGPRSVSAYQSIAWFYAATTGQLSIRHGLRGQCDAVVTEAAGALDGLGQAAATLRRGETRAVLSGGTDSPLSPFGVVCQLASGRLSPSGDPRRAYLPFDAAASGYVCGEGGAMFVVEDAPAARGYGRVAGYAATFDPPPRSGRPRRLRHAIEQALDAAGAAPSDVGVVFADAAGVAELDRAEAAALAEVFGPGGVPVAAPKSGVGRLYSGGAALDVVAALLTMRDGLIPPAVHVRPDPRLGLDLVVGAPRRAGVDLCVVVARGYGGFNAAVVLTRPAPTVQGGTA